MIQDLSKVSLQHVITFSDYSKIDNEQYTEKTEEEEIIKGLLNIENEDKSLLNGNINEILKIIPRTTKQAVEAHGTLQNFFIFM